MILTRLLLLALATLLALPAPSWAAIASDEFNIGASGTGNLSWTHTPVGTARGVIVWCGYASATPQITTIIYGGTTMTEVALSPLTKATGEGGSVHVFFLGSSIPAGAVTIAVTVSESSFKRCSSFTVTAAYDTSVEATDTHTPSDSEDDPSDSITTGASVETFIMTGLLSGLDTSPYPAPGSGYTPRLNSDLGAMLFVLATRDAIATGGAVAYSWSTVSAEDVLMMAVAVKEGVPAAPGACTGRMALLGIGC